MVWVFMIFSAILTVLGASALWIIFSAEVMFNILVSQFGCFFLSTVFIRVNPWPKFLRLSRATNFSG